MKEWPFGGWSGPIPGPSTRVVLPFGCSDAGAPRVSGLGRRTGLQDGAPSPVSARRDRDRRCRTGQERKGRQGRSATGRPAAPTGLAVQTRWLEG